ncbi:MAG: polysaccharide deacetylase family protein [Bacteroidales bacterium]|nr:polysaccharide deacetylase family protein [Bacteroidales bacterium]
MHILTFDIEEWYHLYDHPKRFLTSQKNSHGFSLVKETNRIFRLLEEKNLKATFFWVGEEAQKYPLLVKELNKCGHEVGVHSLSHSKISRENQKMFKTNTEIAVKTIEDIIGVKVKSYRAPAFSLTNESLWALEVLTDLGIEYDNSTVVRKNLGGQIIPSTPFIIKNKDIMMKEFPVNSFSLFGFNYKYGGSGYFRVAPYKFLNPRLISSPYLMSYFHPRDFDKSIHRKIGPNPLLKLKYRLGTQRAFRNLETLSKDILWTSIRDAAKKVNWDKTKIIEV